jgi:predicted RNase H-like HicB family nuclease
MQVTAKVTRTGDWWAVEVPEVPGVFTQAKRLEQVPAMVQDAVGLMLDVDGADVDVSIVPALPDAVERHLEHAKRLMAEAKELEVKASRAAREVVHELREDQGLTVRDVGVLLEVSYQRVSQIGRPSELAISTTRSGRKRMKGQA